MDVMPSCVAKSGCMQVISLPLSRTARTLNDCLVAGLERITGKKSNLALGSYAKRERSDDGAVIESSVVCRSRLVERAAGNARAGGGNCTGGAESATGRYGPGGSVVAAGRAGTGGRPTP